MGETLGDLVKNFDNTLDQHEAVMIKKVAGIDVKQLILIKKIDLNQSEEELSKIIDYDEQLLETKQILNRDEIAEKSNAYFPEMSPKYVIPITSPSKFEKMNDF